MKRIHNTQPAGCHSLKSCLLPLALAALAAAGTGQAQEQAPAAETGAAGGLQEVVVTATRREENLSKVPISVMALTEEALDVRGIKDFSEIVRFTPGVSFDTSGTNNIAIRGIAGTGGAGTTGIYIDETPIQMRALPSIQTRRCRNPSTSPASRCCAGRRARCSAPAPRAAQCATSLSSRA